MANQTPLPYIVYVLRLWSGSDDEAGWRFSLEDPRTGARRGFGDVEELAAFLQSETAKGNRQSRVSGQSGSISDGGHT